MGRHGRGRAVALRLGLLAARGAAGGAGGRGRPRLPLRRRRRSLHPRDHDRPDRAGLDRTSRARMGCSARLPSHGERARASLRGGGEGRGRQRDVPRRSLRHARTGDRARALARSRSRGGAQSRDRGRGCRRSRRRRRSRSLHVDSPWLLGPGVHARSAGSNRARLRELLPADTRVQVDGGINGDTIVVARDAGADLLVSGSAIFWNDDPAAAFRRLVELADTGEGD